MCHSIFFTKVTLLNQFLWSWIELLDSFPAQNIRMTTYNQDHSLKSNEGNSLTLEIQTIKFFELPKGSRIAFQVN